MNPVSSAASAEFGSCISGCARGTAQARSLELEEFVAKMKACETEECKQGTAAEHVANLMAIQYEFKICMTVCHDQGAATGGN